MSSQANLDGLGLSKSRYISSLTLRIYEGFRFNDVQDIVSGSQYICLWYLVLAIVVDYMSVSYGQ